MVHPPRKDSSNYLKVEIIATSSSSGISKCLVAMRSNTCSSLPSFHREMPRVSGLSSHWGILMEQLNVTSLCSLITMCRTVGLNLICPRELAKGSSQGCSVLC